MADSDPSCSNPNSSKSSDNPVKARTRKEYYTRRDASRVYLLDSYTRWREFKEKNNMKTDSEVAEMLLNFYDANQSSLELKRQLCHVETQTEQTNIALSATPRTIRNLPSPLMTSTPTRLSSSTRRRKLLNESSPAMASSISSFSSRFENPVGLEFEETLTGNEGEESDLDDDNDDESMTANEFSLLNESIDSHLEKASLEDDIFNTSLDGHGEEDEDDIGETLTTEPTGYMYTSTVDVITPEEAIKMEKCIVFTDTLMSLLTTLHGDVCKHLDCGRLLEYRKTYVGICLVVSWRCNARHFGGRWSAQPSCDKIRAGNLMLASALLISGNSYTKVGLMFKFCNLQYFSCTLFNQYQQLYIAPAVNEFWQQHKQELWSETAGNNVILSGDGRNDSPGHCAQYCTYSLADMDKKAILQMDIVDVREAAGKSNNMERIGFERGMDELLESPLTIKEVVTDGHLEIAALMKREDKYKNVKHQNDIWHGGKNIAKKINAAAKTKANEDLAIWAPSIRNHFWYCSKHCGNNAKDLKDKWIGILHHVVDEHEWILEEGDNGGKCSHDLLTEEERRKPWLKKDSPAHKALTKIVLDKRFLNTLRYYTNFRHTGFLESFHNHILMYAPKRLSYSFVGYRTRNQLAALDFNHHRGRSQAVTADGEPRFERKFSKRTQRWCHVQVLKPKLYSYIPALLLKVFQKRIRSEGTVNERIGILSEDPRMIAPNISAIPPPSVKSLVEAHKSRF